jgi:hypothetical protein
LVRGCLGLQEAFHVEGWLRQCIGWTSEIDLPNEPLAPGMYDIESANYREGFGSSS